MIFSPEFKFILAACRFCIGVKKPKETEEIIPGRPVDWERLYIYAYLHSVRPQLAQLILRVNPLTVPKGFRERISKSTRDNLLDQISYLAEFLRISQILESVGVVIVPFKGFRLAGDYYGGLGSREGGDIDVYTDFSNLEKIKGLMMLEEYVVEESMARYSLTDLAASAGEYNFDRFDRGKCLYHFEFHWAIGSPVYGMNISFSDLSPQIVNVRIQDQEIRCFSPSADLLLTVMHHGGKDPFNKLKYVHDIAAIMQKQDEIDWDWVLSQARHFRLERLVYVAVCLANMLFETRVPGILASRVNGSITIRLAENRIRYMANTLEYRHPWIIFNEWLFRIRTRSGIRIKIRLALYISGVVARRFLLLGKRKLFRAA